MVEFMKTLWTYCLLTILGASFLFVFMAWQDGERRKGKVKDIVSETVEQGLERSSGDYPASKPVTQDAAPPLVDLASARQMYLEKVVAKEKNATRVILELDRLQQQVNRLQLELDRRNALMAEMRRETAATVLQVQR